MKLSHTRKWAAILFEAVDSTVCNPGGGAVGKRKYEFRSQQSNATSAQQLRNTGGNSAKSYGDSWESGMQNTIVLIISNFICYRSIFINSCGTCILTGKKLIFPTKSLDKDIAESNRHFQGSLYM